MADQTIEFLLSAEDKASSVFASAGKSMAILATAVVAASTAIIAFTNKIAALQEEIGDLNKVTGLSVETLSELSHMAVITNASTEGLAKGIRSLQTATAEAAVGIGTNAQAFDQLGISAKDATGNLRTTESVMAEMADKFMAIKDPMLRTQMGVQLFGRSWADMAKIMAEGSEGMRAMARDAEFLGVTMNKQGVANAGAFRDQMDRVSQAIKGASLAVANEWIPIMTGFARSVADGIAGMKKDFKEWSAAALTAFLTFYATAEIVITKVMAKFKEWFSSAKGFDDFTENARIAFAFIFDVAAKALESIGVMMVGVFKLAWETFVEVGKWAWMKVFDFFTGQDLAGTLGEVLFERIPEATQRTRDELAAVMGQLKAEWTSTAETAAQAVGEVFGISADEIKARVDEIRTKFTELGKAATDTAEQSSTELELLAIKATQARIAALQTYQAAVDQSLVQQNEKDVMQFEMAQERLTLALQMRQITEEQFQALTSQNIINLKAKEGENWAVVEFNKRRVSAMTLDQQLAYTAQSLGAISQLMNSNSKSAFRIGKAAALAQAVISTYTSATNAYQSASAIPVVGWILGPIAAVAAIAMGMQNVAKIRSTQFGSSSVSGASGGSMPSAAGAAATADSYTPATAVQPGIGVGTPAGQATGPTRNITINIDGSGIPTQDWLRYNLIPAINDAAGDGINIQANSV